MLEGLYSAAAGMAAQQQRMDSLANDVANVNTSGYKSVRTGFRDLVYAQTGRGAAAGVTNGAGSASQYIGRSFVQGPMNPTGNPLDVAIQGQGFFQVRTAQGQPALTRDGSFHINERGLLVNSGGAIVQPQINLGGADPTKITIASDGTVTSGTAVVGRIAVVNVNSPDALTSAGDNLFTANAQSGAPRAAGPGTTLSAGTLEGSNVELSDAMVDMMDAQRAFELSSKAIKQQDEMAGIANGVKR
jgi:flagellar basal-body rod protein FlgG